MKDSLYLAIQYLKYHRLRSVLLIVAISIIIFLPNALKRLITDSEDQLMARASVTPLIIGAKGSSSDLVLNTLYFQQEKIEQIAFKDVKTANETGFGLAIPIFSAFNSQGYPIVGTDLDYFDFRGLAINQGRRFSYIGECVLGATVAAELGLRPGDHIISSPENFFDIAGVYPLKMKVVGVLAPNFSPDDKALFTDLKTTWIIAGLGHGHQDLAEIEDNTIVVNPGEDNLTATAKLKIYQEISEENRDDIHFHGSMDDYPLTSIIFNPTDDKASTLLRGRYEGSDLQNQITVPTQVVQNLIQRIFKIRALFDLMFLLVGVATLLIFLLIVVLSIRLRKGEIETLFIIGSSRGKLLEMLGLEIILVLAVSSLLAYGLLAFTGLYVEKFIQTFILS